MALKVYGTPFSTCTVRVMTCLREKGVEFELVSLDLFSGEHKRPPYLAKNPFGQVPALEDGDLTLFESRAITAYVCEKFKSTGCDLTRHQDPKEAALVRVWLEVEAQQFNPAIQPIVFQMLVGPMQGKTPDQAIIDTNMEKLGKVLDVYEARLSTTKYLAGDFFSLADLHHLPYAYYLMTTPAASVINGRPHVKAWWEDISTRPAFVKVAEGMTFGQK